MTKQLKKSRTRKKFMAESDIKAMAQFALNHLREARKLAPASCAGGAFEELPGIQFIDSLLSRFGPIFSDASAEEFMLEIQENIALLLDTDNMITEQFQQDGIFEAELGAHEIRTDASQAIESLISTEEFFESHDFLTNTQNIFSSDVGDPILIWPIHENSLNRFTQQYVAGAEHKIKSNAMAGGIAKAAKAKTTQEKYLIKQCWQDWRNGKTNYKNNERFIDDMIEKVEFLKCNSTTINSWIRQWEIEHQSSQDKK